jgi:hypothetical protein
VVDSKGQWFPVMGDIMNEPGGHCVKLNKPDTERQISQGFTYL